MAITQLNQKQLEDNNFNYGLARNAIINGNFDVWQRGVTLTTTTGGYIADRWTNIVATSSTVISQQAFTLGQTDVPNEPKYFHRSVVTSTAGATNRSAFGQYIEGVRTFAGQKVTLSFWAKADANKNIALEFFQNFGNGGSPSSAVFGIGSQLIALTTSWVKHNITVDIPSISGKTLGTSSDLLGLLFWFDAGSSFNTRSASLGQQSGTFDIAQVQLCAGDVALPFMPKSFEEELRACRRYLRPLPQGEYRSQLYAASVIHFNIPTGEQMRDTTLVLTATAETVGWAVYKTDTTLQTGFTIALGITDSHGIYLNMSKTSHGLTDAVLNINTNTNFLSAEL